MFWNLLTAALIVREWPLLPVREGGNYGRKPPTERICMQINTVILAGNLTKDPELRETPNGVPVTNLRIAANRGNKENSEVVFMDVTAWKKTAEVVCEFCRQGDELVVEGRITQDEWVDKNGNKRTKHQIVAHNVQFKLPPMEESTTLGAGNENATPF
tara:strand:- start:3383 stop:3856 length:474 start_codon:yes stop_codon:yes gene_type:complete